MNKVIVTKSPEETIEFARGLSERLRGGDFVALVGDLGAGKTVFVKGLAKGIGIEDYMYVNSPSFVILKEYHGKKNLYHFDIYRLEEESFEDTLDYKRYFYGDGIAVVEWANKIPDLLPDEYLEVKIAYTEGCNSRKFELNGIGQRFEEVVESI